MKVVKSYLNHAHYLQGMACDSCRQAQGLACIVLVTDPTWQKETFGFLTADLDNFQVSFNTLSNTSITGKAVTFRLKL